MWVGMIDFFSSTETMCVLSLFDELISCLHASWCSCLSETTCCLMLHLKIWSSRTSSFHATRTAKTWSLPGPWVIPLWWRPQVLQRKSSSARIAQHRVWGCRSVRRERRDRTVWGCCCICCAFGSAWELDVGSQSGCPPTHYHGNGQQPI